MDISKFCLVFMVVLTIQSIVAFRYRNQGHGNSRYRYARRLPSISSIVIDFKRRADQCKGMFVCDGTAIRSFPFECIDLKQVCNNAPNCANGEDETVELCGDHATDAPTTAPTTAPTNVTEPATTPATQTATEPATTPATTGVPCEECDCTDAVTCAPCTEEECPPCVVDECDVAAEPLKCRSGEASPAVVLFKMLAFGDFNLVKETCAALCTRYPDCVSVGLAVDQDECFLMTTTDPAEGGYNVEIVDGSCDETPNGNGFYLC